MITIKTAHELELMQAGGAIAREAIDKAIRAVGVGVSAFTLNKLAEELIHARGGLPCFKGYEGFPFATCINVNAGIVHGIPTGYRFKKGDIVSVDLGVLYRGYNTDVSETVEVGSSKEDQFLQLGRKALELAIFECREGGRVGDIANAIQKTIEDKGYSVSRDLVGHGIGRKVHEDPFVPCFGKPDTLERLCKGMTLAIEVIYQKGSPKLSLGKDGWTLSTWDGSLAALFEKTVAVTAGEALVLT